MRKKSILENFRICDGGLFYVSQESGEQLYICDQIRVVALTEEVDSRKTGRLVQFQTRKKQLKQMNILDEWLARDGAVVRSKLMSVGFKISTEGFARRKFNGYLNLCEPKDCIKIFATEQFRESEKIFERLKCFLEHHKCNRFYDLTGLKSQRIKNIAGYKETRENGETIFYVLPSVFREEICADLNHKNAVNTLLNKGALLKNQKGEYCQPKRTPHGIKRLYLIKKVA